MNAEKVAQVFNGLNRWDIAGAFFALLSTVGTVDVVLYRAGRPVLRAAGVQGGYFQRINFDRVEITNSSNSLTEWHYGPDEGGIAGAVTATIISPMVSDALDAQNPIGSVVAVAAHMKALSPSSSWDRLRSSILRGLRGHLHVIDQAQPNDHATENDQAYTGLGTQAAVAGQFSHIQLKNPLASGKVLFLDRVRFTAGAGLGVAQRIDMGQVNADLTNNTGSVQRKNLGGVGSAAQVRVQANAASLVAVIHSWRIAGALRQTENFCPPVRLAAGEGYAIVSPTVNQALDAEFEFREY